MNFYKTITGLVQTTSSIKATQLEMKIHYMNFCKLNNFTFNESHTGYAIYDKHLCLIRYDIETRTQILENDQKQIAGKPINNN